MTKSDRPRPVEKGDALDRETLLAYEAPPPPADLADRVLASLRADTAEATRSGPGRRRNRRWRQIVAALVAAGAIALLLRGEKSEEATASGNRRSIDVRESIAIGSRAVAVAEAGSELSWTVLPDGTATLGQTRGDVFYRVTPGRSFVVTLPGASVRVLGTCFRLEVSEMRYERRSIAAGAAGAALSAAVLVTVYEGRVLVESPHGEVALGPGERGIAAAGAPPAQLTRAAIAQSAPSGRVLEDRVRKLEAELHQARKQLEEGSGTGDPNASKRFQNEQRDPAWAPAQERRVEERLTRFLGVDGGNIECRNTCCEVILDPDDWAKVSPSIPRDIHLGPPPPGSEPQLSRTNDLLSSVGLGHFAANRPMMVGGSAPGESDDGRGHTFFCLAPEDREPRPDQVDRGQELETLLAAARSSAEACMKGSATPLSLRTALTIDHMGEVTDADSVAEPLGHPAAECAERALLAATRFAPSGKTDQGFVVTLDLEPRP